MKKSNNTILLADMVVQNNIISENGHKGVNTVINVIKNVCIILQVK